VTHTNLKRGDREQSETNLLRKTIALITLRRRLGTRDWLSYLLKSLIVLRLLHYVFGFDKWHVHNTYENRPYKKRIVQRLNEIRPRVVVEVGCGLGEIVSRLNAKMRIGIDADKNLLRAAKLLNWRKNVTFLDGSISTTGCIRQSEIDCLIMVNWLHNVSDEEIVGEMKQLLQQKTVRYLIVDEILDGIEGYKFHHRFREILRDWFTNYAEVEDEEGVRRIIVLERKDRDH